jgi:predicted RNA binding protein YcfA (HicA-like mRNA interferase family)
MSRGKKLLERLKTKPKDFTWAELEAVLDGLGYRQEKGSGSRRKFIHEETGAMISLHQPHPRKELKSYQIRDILTHLREEHYL